MNISSAAPASYVPPAAAKTPVRKADNDGDGDDGAAKASSAVAAANAAGAEAAEKTSGRLNITA